MNRLYVVGMGPGGYEKMTVEAQTVLTGCEVIAGYTVYVDLLKDKFPDKQYLVTGMKKEIERCRMAFQSAMAGRTTAMICSGDAGIYGMAGILLEMGEDYPQVEISVVAGVTAAVSGAAVLGAPLGHDFAVISLSDLLTPWDKIELRLRYAAMSDFAVCLYNPSSTKRRDYLQRACRIILEYQSPNTVCGFVRNIGRNGEEYEIMTLDRLERTQVDMFTTVFIGNSQTKKIGDRMVTPRGYEILPSIEHEQ
ncbi:MAG: precorrin-3B C(17)-methyltransferase [Lachnospiraceae bacterium]|nr:precorrin-3B C(17)-methyltransferase [Lachnospiraceae bacterium]